MSDAPKETSRLVASGEFTYPITEVTQISRETQEPKSRKERSRTPSPPPPLFTYDKNTSRTTWHKQTADEQNYIQLVVEREGFPHGAIIADRIDPHLLFKVAPALQKRLEGRRIFIPPTACLDEEVIESMVFGLIRCAKEDIPMPEPVEKKPVTMIMIHCVLVFFEMEKEAQNIVQKLWDLFQQVKLTPMDVLWIWDTFSGRVQSEPYTAPFAHEYVQMMAWQILNLDAVSVLDQDIRHLIELEKEPKYFTETMEARFKTHGLGKDPIVPEALKEVPSPPKVAVAEKTKREINADDDGWSTVTKRSKLKQGNQSITDAKSKSNTSTTTESLPGVKAPAFKSAGVTDVFKSPTPPPTPFGTPTASIPNVGPAASKFSFAGASKAIAADRQAAWRDTPKGSAKRVSFFVGNTKDEEQNNTGLNTRKPTIASTEFSFGGANTSMPTVPNTMTMPSTSSGIGGTPDQPPFGGFGQPAPGATTQALAQSITTTNAVGFAWGSSGATQSTSSAFPQSSNFRGDPFGARTAQQPPQQSVGHFGSGSVLTGGTQGPTPTAGFNLFGGASTQNSGTQHTSPGAPYSNADFNSFSAPASNAPLAGAFGAPPAASSNNVGGFGAPSNNFTPSNGTAQVSNNTGFGMNSSLDGQSPYQQPNGSPFGSPFGNTANTAGAGGNVFDFQGASSGDGGGARSGAMGGGMVRKIAKPTGARRSRR
ncbi:uncharacterized protein N0V89_009427 [Didymosphaeria variabile]|uniref:Uncharacterized protein n=1 Tax=Didymosphaeria variabile TaxID=1932322 RepID=A0A9W8XDQ5_9PLEO|nr:uncharacterized protein N0V89_009427 [Didymosphaeria variabile]KAJ4348055.1 hypothetical protein N0V89_009427 [Didymosphaeria variabile]